MVMKMKFNAHYYRIFCKDLKLKPCRFKNLKIFKEYCLGNYDIIFTIEGDY